jgi:SOS response regulatory protein OraA/RecX
VAPTVTALRLRPDGRVAVALDGEQWRVLPAAAVVRTGLREGVALDRERARTLARELRRADALAEAGRALRHRDFSARRLAERLDRRGIAPEARDQALETLTRTQLVDDERFARSRARSLAERNLGDAAIRHDLERQGIARQLIEQACAELPPEPQRAERVVARRGSSPATARYLARHGFDEDVVERVFARGRPAELG